MSLHSCRTAKALLSAIVLVLLVVMAQPSYAIPAFARQYGTSCSTCHIDFPKLNDFGKAFKDAGFKFPKDDDSMLKIPPVMLGAPANAELWPKAIWPGTIPGIPPIGLRYNQFFQYTGSNRNQFNALLPQGSIGPYVPATDFETGLFSIFTAGNFGSDIAFWVDDDFSVSGANANGGLGEAYLKFVNVGRFLKLPEYALNLRVGQMELDIPFTQSKSIWISPYDIYSQANVGVVNPAFNQQFVNNAYTSAGPHKASNSAVAGIPAATTTPSRSSTRTPAAWDKTRTPAVLISHRPQAATTAVWACRRMPISRTFIRRFNYRFNLEKDKASRNSHPGRRT